MPVSLTVVGMTKMCHSQLKSNVVQAQGFYQCVCEDLGEPTHTLVPCWMPKPLPPRNQCTGWFAPTVREDVSKCISLQLKRVTKSLTESCLRRLLGIILLIFFHCEGLFYFLRGEPDFETSWISSFLILQFFCNLKSGQDLWDSQTPKPYFGTKAQQNQSSIKIFVNVVIYLHA